MKRFLQIILTLAVAFNLAASAAAGIGAACHKPCCERALASEIDRACSAGPSVNAPAMGCCGAVRDAGDSQATFNTGSVLPNFDVASIAGETPALFIGAPVTHPANQTFGAYESPPIFILNASFIC